MIYAFFIVCALFSIYILYTYEITYSLKDIIKKQELLIAYLKESLRKSDISYYKVNKEFADATLEWLKFMKANVDEDEYKEKYFDSEMRLKTLIEQRIEPKLEQDDKKD